MGVVIPIARDNEVVDKLAVRGASNGSAALPKITWRENRRPRRAQAPRTASVLRPLLARSCRRPTAIKFPRCNPRVNPWNLR